MIQNELIARSPLRILERSTHGGLGKGNLGVLAARRGVGKTACLVHVATDQLLRGKHVIHVSFAMNAAHIVDWYEDIFREISQQYSLEQTMAVHDEIVPRRIIMNFNQQTMRLAQAIGSVRAMIREGHFTADCVVVDGYDFARADLEELRLVRSFAAEQGLEIWFAASLGDEQPRYDKAGVPELLGPFMEQISVLICLRARRSTSDCSW
jgi:KaiC/GvpD/RAD55 family RecA-like ATPase